MYRISTSCLLPLLVATVVTGGPDPLLAQEFVKTTVFKRGEHGYKNFRIPAMIQAANGDVLAFCEARMGGDASEIDLVCKRSADQGQSWGELRVVFESQEFADIAGKTRDITIGNPAPVVDRLDAQHPGRIWLPFTLENDQVFVSSSEDHGLTWSRHREITATTKLPGWGWYATGPVHSIQIQRGVHAGRLVIPCDHRIGAAGSDSGDLGAHAILSDDHGRSWRLGAVDDSYADGLNANETAVVELNDGRLYFSTRDQHGDAPGARGFAYSHDGGQTFKRPSDKYSAFEPAAAPLDPPVVQCSLLRALSTLDGDSRNLILFAGPDEDGPSGKGRSDLRIRYTTDETASWQDGPLLHSGPAAYSDMVRLSSDQYGVLFEAGAKSPYEAIVFVKINLGDLQL